MFIFASTLLCFHPYAGLFAELKEWTCNGSSSERAPMCMCECCTLCRTNVSILQRRVAVLSFASFGYDKRPMMKRRSSVAKAADGKEHQETPPYKRTKPERVEAVSDRPQRRQRRPPARHSDYFIPSSVRQRYDDVPPRVELKYEPVEVENDDDDDDDDGPPTLEPEMPTEMPTEMPCTSGREKALSEHSDELGKDDNPDDLSYEDEDAKLLLLGAKRGRPSKGKTGSFLHCPECPFSTRHRERFIKHCKNHQRTAGFKCPLCSFMSTSSGFLKRHCDGHGENYSWPPEYVAGDDSKNNSKDETLEEEAEDHDQDEHHAKGGPESPEFNIRSRPRRSAPAKLDKDYVEGNDDDEEPSFPCPIANCSFASNFKRSLNRHMRNKHGMHPNQPLEQDTVAVKKEDEEGEAEERAETPVEATTPPPTLKRYADLVKKLEHVSSSTSPVPPKEESPQPGQSRKPTRLDKCPHCPYASRFKCDVKAHIELHFGKREFACNLCSYSTIVHRALKNHMNMHNRYDQEMRAEEAAGPRKIANVFEDQTNRNIGSVFCENGGIHRFHCEVCQTDEASNEIYDEHTRQHTDNDVYYSCPQCEFRTEDGQTIIDHAESHPTRAQAYIMRELSPAPSPLREPPKPRGRGRPRKEEFLPRQMKEKVVKVDWKPQTKNGKRKSDEPIMEKCTYCPFETEDNRRYQLHVEMHIGQRPFRCSECSYSCFSPNAIESHRLLHAPGDNAPPSTKQQRSTEQKKTVNGGKGAFACRQCEFRTADVRVYETHCKEHAEEMRKKLLLARELEAHRREELKNQGEAQKVEVRQRRNPAIVKLSCVKCSFKAENIRIYTTHLQHHGDSKCPFKCGVCDYYDDSQDAINTHEEEHHASGTVPRTHYYHFPQFLDTPGELNTEEDMFNKLREKKKNVYCKKCQFNCFDLKQMVEHCEEHHVGTAEDREALEELKMSITVRPSVMV
uniref:C2H2-type domain-containing protein n=1 Tax=Steinernema glaseri TaxID=37863 RepID=A0A1I7YTL8_9BILA